MTLRERERISILKESEAEKITFDKRLINKLRKYFYKVYADTYKPDGKVDADLKGYTGHRIRVICTSGFYPEYETFVDNESIAAFIGKIEREAKEQAESCGLPDEWKAFVYC